jgi:hypothetical protein
MIWTREVRGGIFYRYRVRSSWGKKEKKRRERKKEK